MIEHVRVPEEYHAKVAWSLLFLIILLGILFLIMPLLNLAAEQEDTLFKRYAQLASYQHVAASTPEYERKYAHVRKTGLDTLFYPKGLTSAQVGKELQKQLAAIITRDGGILARSEVLDTKLSDDEVQQSLYQKVMVKANLQGSIKLLRNLLHQAYRARPFIFVEGLTVNPINRSGDKTQQLKAEVIISTYWRGGAKIDENLN